MNALLVRLPLPAYFVAFVIVAMAAYLGANALIHDELNVGRSMMLAVIVGVITTTLERGQRRRGDWDARVRYTRALRGREVAVDVTNWSDWIQSDDRANTRSTVFAVSVLTTLGVLSLVFAQWLAAAVLLSLAALAPISFAVRRRQLHRLRAKLNHPSRGLKS